MNQTTSQRLTSDIHKGDVVVIHPSTGRSGRWTVSAAGFECDRHVSIEFVDEYTSETGEWLLWATADARLTIEISAREAQQVAALALATLLSTPATADLPLVRWFVDDKDSELSAHTSGDDARETLLAWATFFGVEVTDTSHRLTVKAVYEGAPVRLFASIPASAPVDAEAVSA